MKRRVALLIWILAGGLFLLGFQTDPYHAAFVYVVVILLLGLILKLKSMKMQ